MNESLSTKNFKPLIVLLSIVLPAVVAILYFAPKLQLGDGDFSFLPPWNAFVNGTTAVILILGLRAIKNKNVELHRKLMFTALVFSVVFLLGYVLYHLTTPSTHFGGDGFIKQLYYFILITHITLAAVIVPLVLITLVRALSEKFDKHRKIAKVTLPLWLYVSITGVVVYLMISPYYQ